MTISCYKQSFNTKSEAMAHARLIAKKRKGYEGSKVNPYDCEHCGAVHLTSIPRKKYNKIRVNLKKPQKSGNK